MSKATVTIIRCSTRVKREQMAQDTPEQTIDTRKREVKIIKRGTGSEIFPPVPPLQIKSHVREMRAMVDTILGRTSGGTK